MASGGRDGARQLHADPLRHAEPHLRRVAGGPFNLALMGPFAQHTGFDWKDLGVLLAWGAAGTLIAVRRFRWDPRPE